MTSLSENTVVTTSGGLVELGYGEITSGVLVTNTALDGQVVIPAITVVCDGSPVLVEYFSNQVRADTTAGREMQILLMVDGSNEGYIGRAYNAEGGFDNKDASGSFRMTPTAGSHTFGINARVSAGTGYFGGGAGGSSTAELPSFIRVSKIVQASQFIVPLASAPLVTSLPSTGNIDGQEVRYLIDDTSGTIWNLRWRASANRWEPISGFESDRNRIINGAMLVDERRRNSAANSQTNVYVADRFRFLGSGGGNVNVQTVTNDGPTGVSQNSAKITVATQDTSLAAGDYYLFRQGVEGNMIQDLGFGTTSTPITISFYVKSSVTGLFGGSIRNPDNTRCYVFTYTINAANTWERKIISLTADNTGTWGTGTNNGFSLVWSLGHGANATSSVTGWQNGAFNQITGCANLMATAGATWQISGVQLELGPTATPFQQRTFEQELSLCRRYYLRNDSQVYADGNSGNSTVARTGATFPVRMRATPAIILYSGSFLGGTQGHVYVSNTNSGYAMTAGNITHDGFYTVGNAVGIPSTGYTYAFSYTAETEIS